MWKTFHIVTYTKNYTVMIGLHQTDITNTLDEVQKKLHNFFFANIQGVTGGMDQTSEECSLGHTIPI